MIGHLKGQAHRITDTTIIVDINGVGYEVSTPSSDLLTYQEGQEVTLEIYTHINETHFQLFGFKTYKQKQIFKKLISVSGVGPKLGLTIISDLPLPQLFQAVTQGDVAVLNKISGIGKKTAERIIVELKDKFKDEVSLESAQAANDNPAADSRISDAQQALMSLGYQEHQAKKVINGLNIQDSDTVQSLIKKSLTKF